MRCQSGIPPNREWITHPDLRIPESTVGVVRLAGSPCFSRPQTHAEPRFHDPEFRLLFAKLTVEERREIRAKLNELDDEEWFDNGELSEQEKAIIEARLDEYDRNPGAGSSWEEAKARILGGLHGK